MNTKRKEARLYRVKKRKFFKNTTDAMSSLMNDINFHLKCLKKGIPHELVIDYGDNNDW